MCYFCCRYFRHPKPNYCAVADDVSNFVSEIARSLRLGVNRACSFSFVFRTDVFKFLFGGKGRASSHTFAHLYLKEDFDDTYFPPDWFSCSDRLGDFCRVCFPICMYSRIKWLPVVYSKNEHGVTVPSYKEMCYVTLCKERF